MGRRGDSPDFRRSNRILTTSYRPAPQERDLAQRLIRAPRAAEREALGQRLVNAICARLRVAAPRVRVTDAPQPHKRREGRLTYKEYGAYHFDDHVISIANLTAVRGKVVAGKTFFDTLIHEFMHHLDRKLYRIPSTPHSPGFYSRIEDLKRKLAGGPRAPAPAPGEDQAPWSPPPRHLLAALERSLESPDRGRAEEPPPPEKRRPRWRDPLAAGLFGEGAPRPAAPGRAGEKPARNPRKPAPTSTAHRQKGGEQLALGLDEPCFTLDDT